VPTYAWEPRFLREYEALSPSDQARFRNAVEAFVQDLGKGRFRRGLRVKKCQGLGPTWEMTWAPDGRALFRYGLSKGHGPHVIWLRIGTHDQLGL
jgi:hypothetical protein